MSQQQTKKNLFHESLSKQIVEQIKLGTASWLKSQDNEHIDLPYNPVTGKSYKATANIILSAKGYKDNRWLTYDQVAEQGYQVKKGEKATEIAFYHYIDYKTKEKLDKPKIQTVKLFNAEQLTGIEKMPVKTNSKEEALAKVQSIFENSQVKIVNNQKDKVFYRQKEDTVYMPSKDFYKDELAYSSAVIHELCRWAGTGEERLNFPVAPFGTEAFAREKLRTEIATYMLCKELGIPFEPQGQQFVDQWVQVIEKNPFEILNAAKSAERIKEFVMEFDKTMEKQQEIEQNTRKEKRFFELSEYTDYYKVYEYGHRRTTSFNLYDISQLHAMCEEKHRELIELDLLRRQIKDTITINKDEDEDLIEQEKERLEQVEQAQKEGYTYAIYNPNFPENGTTFITGHTVEELIEQISFYPRELDLRSIEIEPMSDHSVDITVPEKDSEKVKELGAEFDEEENRWYIPEGTNLKLFENWMYEKIEIKQEQAISESEKQLETPQKEWKEMIKLSVPYDDKNEAKELGAKWSSKQETWYVLDGTDLQPFYKWLPKEKKVELIMASRDYLNVSKEEKDEAKALGAKWDRWQKAWYVEKGTDLTPFKKWGKLDLKEREQQQQENPAEQTQSTEQQQKAEQNIAEDKTFIAVPYDERKEAKKLGAKWDSDNKSWYVERGQDLAQFKEWLVYENIILPKQETVAPEIEFAQHLRDCGLDVDVPIMDGQIHRVPLIGKPQGKDGAYCGYLDGVPNGWAQNYVTGEKSKFVSSGIKLTEEEKARQRAEHAQKLLEREAKRQRDYDIAANNAKRVLNNSFEADKNHAYLQEKGIKPYTAKLNNYGQLVVPVQNIHGDIRGVQFIEKDGSKKFLSGVEKKGNFALLSEEAKDVSKVLVCEGFATGASLHEATKLPVVVAFDAGNLEAVSKALAEKYKGIEITICADNDLYKENNVGLEYAQNAAKAVNGKLAVPMFTAEEKAQKLTDFNDLHKSQGLEAVKRQVGQAKSLVKQHGLSR